ncbi:MAG: ArsR/SmtB family transcription factor [Candidatus Eiseniibacteriota bacterium]
MIICAADFKSQLYGQLARLTKALASPRRLELVDLLAQRERTVEELALLTAMSVANTSRHLQALRAARLVMVRRAGLHAHYRLADGGVFELWQAVRDLGERRLATMRELVSAHFEGRGALEPVKIPELLDRLHSGAAVLVDARPEDEFLAGHIAGAVNVPVEEMEARLHVLPMDQEVIAYSRGPYCAFADRAVEILRANGYRARRLSLGFPDWRAAGLPVDSAGAGS